MINIGLNISSSQGEIFPCGYDSIKTFILSVKSKELISILKIYFAPVGYPNKGALLKFFESLEKENKFGASGGWTVTKSIWAHLSVSIKFRIFLDMHVDFDLFNVSTGSSM